MTVSTAATNVVKKAKQAGEEAEKLHAEMYGEPDAENEELSEVTGEVAETDEKPEVVETPEVAAAEAEQPTEDRDKDAKFWEQKYKTLQGMYNADIPKLNAQIKELVGNNQNLERILASMQAEPQAPASSDTNITDDDITDYGPDMIDLVKRAAKDEISSLEQEVAQLRNENLQLSQSMGKVNAESEANLRQSVFDTLARELPEWQQINVEPEFLEWLAEADTFSGQPRQNLLMQAFESNDAPRVVAFFRKYVTEKQIVTGQGNQTDTPSPTVELDSLVAPGRPQQTGSVPPSEDVTQGEIWTEQQVQSFYADVQKGKFKNNPKEKDAIERRIMSAANEGRIR